MRGGWNYEKKGNEKKRNGWDGWNIEEKEGASGEGSH